MLNSLIEDFVELLKQMNPSILLKTALLKFIKIIKNMNTLLYTKSAFDVSKIDLIKNRFNIKIQY